MPLAGRRVDGIAGPDLDDLAAAGLDEPDALGDVQRLADRVRMPCVARTRSEVDDAGPETRRLHATRDGVEPDVAGEPVGRGLDRRRLAQDLHAVPPSRGPARSRVGRTDLRWSAVDAVVVPARQPGPPGPTVDDRVEAQSLRPEAIDADPEPAAGHRHERLLVVEAVRGGREGQPEVVRPCLDAEGRDPWVVAAVRPGERRLRGRRLRGRRCGSPFAPRSVATSSSRGPSIDSDPGSRRSRTARARRIASRASAFGLWPGPFWRTTAPMPASGSHCIPAR